MNGGMQPAPRNGPPPGGNGRGGPMNFNNSGQPRGQPGYAPQNGQFRNDNYGRNGGSFDLPRPMPGPGMRTMTRTASADQLVNLNQRGLNRDLFRQNQKNDDDLTMAQDNAFPVFGSPNKKQINQGDGRRRDVYSPSLNGDGDNGVPLAASRSRSPGSASFGNGNGNGYGPPNGYRHNSYDEANGRVRNNANYNGGFSSQRPGPQYRIPTDDGSMRGGRSMPPRSSPGLSHTSAAQPVGRVSPSFRAFDFQTDPPRNDLDDTNDLLDDYANDDDDHNYANRKVSAADRAAQIEAEMPNFDNGNMFGQAVSPEQYQGSFNSRDGPRPSMGSQGGRSVSGASSLGPAPMNRPPPNRQFQDGYGANLNGYDPSRLGASAFPGPNTTRGPITPDDAAQYDIYMSSQQVSPGQQYNTYNPAMNGFEQPRTNSAPPPQMRQDSMDHQNNSNNNILPYHPVPFRPGLGSLPSETMPNTRLPNINASLPPIPQAVADARRLSLSQPVTQAELNRLQSLVNAYPQDAATGLVLVKRLAEAAKVLSSDNGRADFRQTAKNEEKYNTDALRRVKKLVTGGHADAAFYLADCYSDGGLGLEPDQKEAYSLYQAAAKAGHAEAAYRTALCNELGVGGIKIDYPKAVMWYKSAAGAASTPAMYKLGIICLRGLLGQPKAVLEAEKWLKRASEQADEANMHAVHELGLLYEPDHADGDVRAKIVPDEGYSRELFFKAANAGFKASQFRLGQAYEYGTLGLPVGARNSIAWYSKSAAQGDHGAELALSGW